MRLPRGRCPARLTSGRTRWPALPAFRVWIGCDPGTGWLDRPLARARGPFGGWPLALAITTGVALVVVLAAEFVDAATAAGGETGWPGVVGVPADGSRTSQGT